MRRPAPRRRALSVALVSYLFLLGLVATTGSGQLTAYSETRSFRDALDGRFMEEAISGPVDKDTSSYGERTNGGASTEPTAQKTSGGSGGSYGSSSPASEGANSNNAGQMMVNIPANGNLYPGAGQQRTSEPADEQQQKSAGGQEPELEREAGPISPDFPIDTQQQMMEQQQMMRRAKQMVMAMGRSGRLTGSVGEMPAPMVMEMMRALKEESMRKKMATMRRAQLGSMGAFSGRLQQQQTEESDAGQENKYESASPMGGQMQPASNGYGNKMGMQAMGGDAYGSEAEQQMNPARGGAQDKGYDKPDEQEMFGKLQKMAEMRNTRAKYARNGGNGAYKKQPSNMAQSMMMSLANKAAYMANQRQQQVGSQRQTAPMMMPQLNAYGSSEASPMMNSLYPSPGSNSPMGSMQMQRSGAYRAMGMGAVRAMRRANQRKTEKKISPAMMNAMLNKMLGGRPTPADEQAPQGGSYGGQSSNARAGAMQMAMAAMLMKQPAPMRAEMFNQMMSMSGNNGDDSQSSGYGNSNNKRELYKQMMMSAMQQAQSEEQSQEVDQQQQMAPMGGAGSGYGERASPAARPMMGSGEYGSTSPKSSYGQSESTTPSSYSGSSSPSPMSTMSYGGAAAKGMPQQSPADSSVSYETQQDQQKMTNEMESAKGAQPEAVTPYGGRGSGGAMKAPQMRMTSQVGGYGQPNSMASRTANGKLMQQVMQMMRMKQLAMNGGQQRKTYGGGDQEQQQQQMDAGSSMEGEKGPAGNPRQSYSSGGERQEQQQQQDQSDSKDYGGQQANKPSAYGTKSGASDEQTSDSGVKGGAGAGSMNKPAMSMGMSYGQEQQQRDGEGDQQEQQQQSSEEDQYGSAPMGQAEPFAFDYKVEDEATGNNQYRKEESDKNGVVRGSYGYMDANSGVYRHVEYVADENGFRAKIKSNEPGLSDKATGNDQQQQQQQQQQTESAGEGTKSPPSDESAYQPRGPSSAAPPSSSSSLGGSAALMQQQQQDSQVPMSPPMMDDKTQQRSMQVPQSNQRQLREEQKQMPSYQGQQQQQATAGELKK